MLQDYNKLLVATVKLYIKHCTNQQAFVNKRFSPLYWQIYKYLQKRCGYTDIKCLHDYLSSKEEHSIQTLSEVFKRAELYRRQRIVEAEKAMNAQIEWEEPEQEDDGKFTLDKFLSL